MIDTIEGLFLIKRHQNRGLVGHSDHVERIANEMKVGKYRATDDPAILILVNNGIHNSFKALRHYFRGQFVIGIKQGNRTPVR